MKLHMSRVASGSEGTSPSQQMAESVPISHRASRSPQRPRAVGLRGACRCRLVSSSVCLEPTSTQVDLRILATLLVSQLGLGKPRQVTGTQIQTSRKT